MKSEKKIASPSLFTYSSFWFHSIRPKTLLVTISPLLIAYSMLNPISSFNQLHFLIYVLACLSLQIACNFTNEYYDFIKGVDDQERKGPIRMLQKKNLSLNQMKWGMIITFSISILGAVYLAWHYGLQILIIAIISAIAAFSYTGGKKPYGYRGWGEIIAFLFFGPVIVLIPFTMFFSWSELFTTPMISPKILFLTIGAGCFAWVLISINNLRDYENDKKHKKTTLTVILGKKSIKRILITLLVSGNILLYSIIHNQTHHFLFLSALIFIGLITKFIIYEKKLNQALGLTSLNYLSNSILIYYLY